MPVSRRGIGFTLALRKLSVALLSKFIPVESFRVPAASVVGEDKGLDKE